MEIDELVRGQRRFFEKGCTKSLAFRMQALERLERTVKRYEGEIRQALYQDLHKSSFESYMTETGLVLSELAFVKKHLKGWMREKTVHTPLAQFPARSFVTHEPFGVVLVMAPWNYPFMLCMDPLIGAIAAGNCCILKPSGYAKHVSAVIAKMIREAFPPEFAAVVEGGREENQELLEQRFDYIFFTGGVTVGRLVMEKAARNLTPVTLELGGKSPCIVDHTANLKMAAKRLVFGKYLNSGQTCVAPDYLLVQEDVKEEFLVYVKHFIRQMFGEEPLKNPDYPRMINEKHYHRVMGLLKDEKAETGGYGDEEHLQIAPTVLTGITEDSPVMQEEIFGPVLPVLTFGEKNHSLFSVLYLINVFKPQFLVELQTFFHIICWDSDVLQSCYIIFHPMYSPFLCDRVTVQYPHSYRQKSMQNRLWRWDLCLAVVHFLTIMFDASAYIRIE